jgi:hypothetical protein
LILSWNFAVGMVFTIILLKIQVETVMVGILGGILSCLTAAIAAVTGFWLANSLNSNRSNAAKDAVIAQSAGAGPAPPEPANPVAVGGAGAGG